MMVFSWVAMKDCCVVPELSVSNHVAIKAVTPGPLGDGDFVKSSKSL